MIYSLLYGRVNSNIEFVLCRHEQAAAFMADAYGRLTGKAGVCLVTLGPGATNLVTGLADANMDRAPVVAIIGQGSTKRLHKEQQNGFDGRHSDLAFGNPDFAAMDNAFGMWGRVVDRADQFTPALDEAFKLQGPALIAVPVDYSENMKLTGRPRSVQVPI